MRRILERRPGWTYSDIAALTIDQALHALNIDADYKAANQAIARRKREIFDGVCRRFGLQRASLRLLPAEVLAELIHFAGGPSVSPDLLRKDL